MEFLPKMFASFVFIVSSVAALAGARGGVAGLESPDLKAREASADRIKKDRHELVQELIRLASARIEPNIIKAGDREFKVYPRYDAKHFVILLLGHLRAAEAVDVLLENLEYENPRKDAFTAREGPAPEFDYPAVESLVRIGNPAVEPVVKRLASGQDKGRARSNCIWILRAILGDDLAKAKLKLAIENYSYNRQVQANLAAALTDIR